MSYQILLQSKKWYWEMLWNISSYLTVGSLRPADAEGLQTCHSYTASAASGPTHKRNDRLCFRGTGTAGSVHSSVTDMSGTPYHCHATTDKMYKYDFISRQHKWTLQPSAHHDLHIYQIIWHTVVFDQTTQTSANFENRFMFKITPHTNINGIKQMQLYYKQIFSHSSVTAL